MLTSKKVKEYAKRYGADIVGIASFERFEGAPRHMDLRYIFSDGKAVIVMGFRHFRGVFRGIEEGTFFTAYSAMGYAGINYIYQPIVLWNLSKSIEDEGYEAVPIPNNFPWSTGLTTSKPNLDFSRPISPDKPAPDVFMHLRIAAFCAGLGEIGYSKMFLSPQYGPRQRLACIITDAPLEPDPLFEGKLCDRCMACVSACSVQAIPKGKTIKITVAGREIEWADIDYDKCGVGYCGGGKEANPFMFTKEDEMRFTALVGSEGDYNYKLHPMYVYARALEGASGCIRACMIHLEQQGRIKNIFKEPFRKRKPWRL